jgi:hypothetical protein
MFLSCSRILLMTSLSNFSKSKVRLYLYLGGR